MSIVQLISDAIQRRFQGHSKYADRIAYFGASEIGLCLRHVISSKLNPLCIDSASVGRILAGRALENEIVQIVRTVLKGQVRETGRQQRELVHATLPFRAHPDGRLLLDEGEALLEVKTASSSSFKRYAESGLPKHYLDQVQAQMGLSGVPRALVVLASREDLSQIQTFEVAFDPAHYSGLEQRAARAAAYLGDCTLPEGEPDRGFCHQCPLAGQCEALQKRKEAGKRGDVPEVLKLQLEAEVEELAGLEADLEPMQARVAELREQIREALDISGASKIVLGLGTVQLVSGSRSSFDSKRLQAESPDIFSRFQKTSTYTTLRINYRNKVQQAS